MISESILEDYIIRMNDVLIKIEKIVHIIKCD
jgi:hypothetical protein